MFIKVVTNKLDHCCGVLFQRRTFSVFICTHSTLFHQSVKTGNTLTLYDMIPAEQQTLVSCNLSGLSLEKKSEQSNLHPVYTHVWISEVYSLRDKCYYVCEHLKCKTWKWTYPLFTVVDDFALIVAKVTEVLSNPGELHVSSVRAVLFNMVIWDMVMRAQQPCPSLRESQSDKIWLNAVYQDGEWLLVEQWHGMKPSWLNETLIGRTKCLLMQSCWSSP